MKQILQNLRNGSTELAEVPVPGIGRGQVLIRTSRTVVSVGTERMVIDFGKAGWLEKARQQPEKVQQVLDKVRSDGLIPTVEAVFRKLDEPIPLGYCNAGVVQEVGTGITDLQPGDRVASNGPHAEWVCVPRNLCAKIPDGVTDEEAAFTALGSIALQGIRLAMPTFGERFMIFGLGLVGLLAVQLLRASGCLVLAVDMSEERLKLAETFGADTIRVDLGADPVAAALACTGGKGVDGAILAASAKGDQIVHQAAQACRKRGRLILVGVVDLNLLRSDFYEKELTFQVSCSYGPGRYDDKYEQAGQDYPFGFVRWTEQRNFEAILEAMRAGHIRVKDLITHRVAMEEAAEVYDKVLHDSSTLGIVIEYPHSAQAKIQRVPVSSPLLRSSIMDKENNGVAVGIIGAGNYARSTLLPALRRTKAKIAAIADINGVAATYAANKYQAEKAVSDFRLILDDPNIRAVFVLVGHHLHARFAREVLEAGKHVFVEKPLAVHEAELHDLISFYSALGTRGPSPPLLMVGFNRRFSPHIIKIRDLIAGRSEPLCMNMTINAGYIPPEHWTQDPERGGGRIIGEACHFIDLLAFLSGSPVTSVSSAMVGGRGPIREDRMSILLSFADGSIGTVQYFANGARSYPKETLEVFGEERVIRMENFRRTTGYGFMGFRSFRTWRQDKGHRTEIAAFVERASSGGPALIPFEQLVNVTQASFAAVESARTGKAIAIPLEFPTRSGIAGTR